MTEKARKKSEVYNFGSKTGKVLGNDGAETAAKGIFRYLIILFR